MTLRPIAILRWCVLRGGEKVTPGRRYHLYLTSCGSVIREERDGDAALEIWPLDDVMSMSFAPNTGTAAAALALQLDPQ